MDSDAMSKKDIGMKLISQSLFKGLCHTLGTPQQVAMRRDALDLIEMVDTLQGADVQFRFLPSGSRREGFRFKGSDMDIMLWSKDHKVIWDMEQTRNYNRDKHTLILSDCSDSPPGYTQLVLITQTNMESVYLACISSNDRLFISSSALRKITLSGLFPDFTEHGPCSSGFMYDMNHDTAHCFASDIWPPWAFPWIARSHVWPGSQIVNEIVKSGCHVVPIGHKQGNHEDDEWRISFSLAEQKLVFSMNHSQFLTYGLLKLFLKEVIKDGLGTEDKLLCSYHMKTAVFWVLQQNTIRDWCPQNLLECFLVCFRYILKCVYEGVCPNFFIPKNNMILGKIHGKVQNDLFIKLYALYERGYSSLLYSSTISSYMIHEPNNPGQLLCTDEHTLI